MLSIDITDKQIRLVRGALNGNKIRVLEVETRDLTAGSISNGYVTDIPMVAGEITDIIATKNIKEKDAIVCINSGSILYKDLTVPKPKKISNSAAIESMILTTMGITKEYNISYSIIGEDKDENEQPVLKILATAVPQRMVDGYIRLFTQLGIKLQQINVSNNCITRLILNTPKLEASMPLMLVQIDNDFININLYEDNQLSLSRYVRVDPYDYNNDEDYVNQAVYDNIFRTLQLFRDAHLVHALEDTGEGIRYELCHSHSHETDDDLHVHFFCEKCHRTLCLEDVHIPEVVVPEGYSALSASYLIRGICPSCQK